MEGFDNTDANKNFVTVYAQGIVDTYIHMKTCHYLQGFGSDHVSFNNAGYISILLITKEWNHPAYHKNFDTLDCPDGLNDMQLFEGITKTGTAAIADFAVPIPGTEVSGAASGREGSLAGARIELIGGEIRITTPRLSDRPYSVEIYSAQGTIVHAARPVSFGRAKTVSLPLPRHNASPIANGIYFVRVANDEVQRTGKIVMF